MIVPMYRYSFLVHHVDYNQFVDDLKQIGVLHVIEREQEMTVEMQESLRIMSEVDKAIKYLNLIKEVYTPVKFDLPQTGEECMSLIKEYQDSLERQKQQLVVNEKEAKQLAPWGFFSWESVERLKEAGLDIHFYYCANRNFKEEWEEAYCIERIAEEKGFTYFILVKKNEEELPEFGADEILLPARTIETIHKQIQNIKEELDNLNGRLASMAQYSLPVLVEYQLDLKETFVDSRVQLHTGDEVAGTVKLLEGWVPELKKVSIDQYLEQNSILYLQERGNITDNPPVLLKNNSFNKLFEPIGKLYSLPNYGELDLTPYLAPFYLLFFGFCFSDAGYGLLFVLVSTFLKLKQQKPQPILSLVQLLGASTMLFGMLGGTFFGIELYNTNLPIYKNIAQLYGTEELPIGKLIQDIMLKASLALGLIQILFGMFLRAVKITNQSGFKHAISTLSWALLIVSSIINYFVTSGDNFFNWYFVLISFVFGVGIFFMNSPGKNLFVNFGIGLWDAYNTIVGGIGDLLSYVRLFALGLASAILGFVFNDLGTKLVDPDAGLLMQIIGYFLMLIVLLVGHAINIFMSGLGSMVHPLRLTFVEFFKNAGFEGGGKPYSPYKEQSLE
ncbi:MAG: V-type ATP synthase subunit I [Marinilabiliaceae bacterium]|nr:V-type ATP synthase subunit I [Marinilabiliaceae bacterium]